MRSVAFVCRGFASCLLRRIFKHGKHGKHGLKCWLCYGLAGLTTLAVTTLAWAQPAPVMPINTVMPVAPVTIGESIEERLHQRQQDTTQAQLEQLQRPPDGTVLKSLQHNAEERFAPGCVAIQDVQLDGLTLFKRAEFTAAIAATLGDCVNLSQVDELLREITNRYVAKGYVAARALIPQQDLADGQLQVVVVEGVVDEVVGAGPFTGRRALRFAFPGVAGHPLNLRQLEQGIDQLSRLASGRAEIDIQPGALPGTSRVRVRNRKAQNRLRGSLSADNLGQSATNRFNHALSLEADNLLGANDYWSLAWNRDAEYGDAVGTRGVSGVFSLPYGRWTLNLSGGQFSYNSVINGRFEDFASDGDSWHASLEIHRLLYRDARRKLSLSGGLRLTDTENFIEAVRLLASSYRLAVPSVGVHYQQTVGGGLVNATVQVRRGIDAFGAQSIETDSAGPQRIFTQLGLQASYLRPFKLGRREARYLGVLRAQWAGSNLFAAQRLSLGSPSTVRGFLDGGVSGDRGGVLRQEVSVLAVQAKRLSLSVFGAYDVGAIISDDPDQFPFERGVLQSLSGGLRLSSRRFSGQMTLSHAFDHPAFLAPKGVQLTGSFSIRF